MKRLTLEARIWQGVVEYAIKKGKSAAAKNMVSACHASNDGASDMMAQGNQSV